MEIRRQIESVLALHGITSACAVEDLVELVQASRGGAMTERVEEIRQKWESNYWDDLHLICHKAIGALLTALAQAEREREEFQHKYHESMDILSAYDKIDHADAVAQLIAAQAEVERLKDDATLHDLKFTEASGMIGDLQADLASVRAALTWLWWTACHVEVEPVDEKWGTDVRPRTLSEVMTEKERAEIRAALEGRG